MTSPKVTVLMPLYNGERYLVPAIDSILHQTFSDFELLVVCDPSTDRGIEMVESYNDPRIRLWKNETRRGFVDSMNLGLDMASGEYVAIMDSDDVSLPHRLARQVEFMDSHSGIGGCGSWVRVFGEDQRTTWKYPIEPNEVACRMLFRMAFANPSVMLRKGLLDKFCIRYREGYNGACDWDLLQRCTQRFPMSNIPEILLWYRYSLLSVTHVDPNRLEEGVRTVCIHRLAELGLHPTPQELQVHVGLSLLDLVPHEDLVTVAESFLIKLGKANQSLGLYPEPAFSARLSMEWFYTCRKSSHLGLWTWRAFNSSALRGSAVATVMLLLLLTKCVLKWDERK